MEQKNVANDRKLLYNNFRIQVIHDFNMKSRETVSVRCW